MPGHDIIVISTSAGGVEALQTLVRDLPPDLPATVFVVLHLTPEGTSFLPQILNRAGALPAATAIGGEAIIPGRIYVAPPDHHLLVEPGFVRVARGPKENRFRPAIDALFRSAAYAYGPRVVGVILTGMLDDSTAGLWAVKDRGGLAVVQDPLEAFAPAMPQSALRHVAVDACVPLAKMGRTLAQFTREPAAAEGDYPVSKKLAIETRIARADQQVDTGLLEVGELSPYTCPECHGSLVQLRDGDITRFRCHTGHAFSMNSLLAEVSESLETSLGNTQRVLNESRLLLRHLAYHARDRGEDGLAERAEQKARNAEQSAQILRDLLARQDALSEDQLRRQTG
ncbi:MAG TPA: chemotaxis protein CheB [Alphaproteobacteria bacterium]|nr:chemotaxis protein CheB [Alphaproteobacteria bacterium]